MPSSTSFSFEPPVRDPLIDTMKMISRPWETFFRFLQQVVDPLGVEKFFAIVNNQTAAADVVGLAFNSKTISQAIFEYLIQRVTTGTGATEIIQTGVIHAVFKPTSLTWELVTMGTPGPSASGIVFSVTAAGQVRYTSSNITGTASISKLSYRLRTIAGKNAKYSTVGR